METLVRFLESQNAPLNITIQLPAVGSTQASGEPMIIKTPPVETVSWPSSVVGIVSPVDGQGK
jgi:hypothetical protein